MSAVVVASGPQGAGSAEGAGRWPLMELAWGAALLVALVYAHLAPLAGMVHQWDVSPMYSYGYTVPFVSGYLIWVRKDALLRLSPQPSRAAGAVVLLLAMAMLVVGGAAGVQVVQQLAFIVSLVGAVLLLIGKAYLGVVWAGVAYLLLMVPLWDAFTEPLHWPFQQRSAAIGVWLLQAAGVPAFREGTFIALPTVNLEVARACSGVNYLVAVIALGLPLGYVYLSTMWRRALLLTFAVAVAALSNGLRVALIGWLAYLEIGSPLHGPFHVLHGLFVAGIGYVALFAGLRLLADSPAVPVAGPVNGAPHVPRKLPRLEASALVVVCVLAGSGVLAQDTAPVPLAAAMEDLPLEIGPWRRDAGAWISPLAELWPGADVSVHRRYLSGAGEAVGVFVGYFERQEQDRELASFRSAGLHRQGSPVRIAGPSGEGFTANVVRAASGQVETVFWYEVDGAAHATPRAAKLQTTWNVLAGGRSNGAVIALSALPSILAPRHVSEEALHVMAWQVRQALAPYLAGSVRRVQ